MQHSRLTYVAGWTALLVVLQVVSGQDRRLVERDGLMYEEYTTTVRQPIAETQLVSQQQTVYEPKLITELRNVPVTRWQLVTTNQWQERVENPLGIRGPRQTVGQWAPTTRWEQRTEYVRQPVTYRASVPEIRTVQLPMRTMRFVEKQETQRVLVGPAAAYQQAASPTANYTPAYSPRSATAPRFDDDKLRYGMKPTDASVWR